MVSLWRALTLTIILMLSFLVPIGPHDYWWHLRLGGDILSSGAIPQVDQYSYTQLGKPIIYQGWLAAVILNLVYQAGEIPITILLRAALVAGAYMLLWRMAISAGAHRIAASLSVIVGALSGTLFWGVRPQLFIFPLFAYAVVLLVRWSKEAPRSHPESRVGYTPLVLRFALLAFLWANLHGSFPLLLALMALSLLAGGGDRRALAIALIGSVAATAITPVGLDLWRGAVQTLAGSDARNLSAEWQPPTAQGWQLSLFFGWLLLTTIRAGIARNRLSLMEWCWLVAFTWLAFSGVRYVVWLIFVIIALSPSLWPARREEEGGRAHTGSFASSAFGFCLVLAAALFFAPVRNLWDSKGTPTLVDTPTDATAWLRNHPEITGNLWAELGFSSYLIFALPERPVAVDTRFQVAYTTEQLTDYRNITLAAEGWERLLSKIDARILMVSRIQQPQLLAALERAPGWQEQYRDQDAVIFTARGLG